MEGSASSYRLLKNTETRFGLPCLLGKAADRLDGQGHQKYPRFMSNCGSRLNLRREKEAIHDFPTRIVFGLLAGLNASEIASKHGGKDRPRYSARRPGCRGRRMVVRSVRGTGEWTEFAQSAGSCSGRGGGSSWRTTRLNAPSEFRDGSNRHNSLRGCLTRLRADGVAPDHLVRPQPISYFCRPQVGSPFTRI